MREFFGPLDGEGRVPPHQQTRVAAFLISAHSALLRRFGFALPLNMQSAWQIELNAQFFKESEIVSLLTRATSWAPDLAVGYYAAYWEAAWVPMPAGGFSDQILALQVDFAALAHAVHSCIRPAALVPAEANANDPFVMALRRIELESGRSLQVEIIFLKDARLVPLRAEVSASLERRHAQVRRLWREMLRSVDIRVCDENDAKP